MPTRSPSGFGAYLRRTRVAAGLSLRDVAEAMNPPISHVSLAEVERGVRLGLKRERWLQLEQVIPGFSVAEAERITAQDRPIQMPVGTAPKAYQDLALALARRIDRRDLSANDLAELLRILGHDDEGVDG